MKYLKKFLIYLFPWSQEFKKFVRTPQHSTYVQFIIFKLRLSSLYWPKNATCTIANKSNIYVGINTLVGRPGNYIQGKGGVYFGNYVQLAPNVGILSSNHDLYDQRKSNDIKVVIGDYCWVGMNSVILPGVKLGTRTIVAAGSVVTKSFPNGFCILAGSPAKIIKYLDKEKFEPWRDKNEFYGFIPKLDFEKKYADKIRRIREEIDAMQFNIENDLSD